MLCSVGNFLACMIRKSHNEFMETKDSYDINDKSYAGAYAGVVKYSFIAHTTSLKGITPTVVIAGALNNLVYRIEPEIKGIIGSSCGNATADTYSLISPLLIESSEWVLVSYLTGDSMPILNSIENGLKIGSLIAFFGNILYPYALDLAETGTSVDDLVRHDFSGTTLTHNVAGEVHDEL